MTGTAEQQPAVPPADVFAGACTSRAVLQHLTGRWGALTMVALKLADGPVRFSVIRRQVDGISDRMLSQTLGQLEFDGMVERRVHSTIPPHVEYVLTELGQKIAEPLLTLIQTLESEFPRVVAAHEAANQRMAANTKAATP